MICFWAELLASFLLADYLIDFWYDIWYMMIDHIPYKIFRQTDDKSYSNRINRIYIIKAADWMNCLCHLDDLIFKLFPLSILILSNQTVLMKSETNFLLKWLLQYAEKFFRVFTQEMKSNFCVMAIETYRIIIPSGKYIKSTY